MAPLLAAQDAVRAAIVHAGRQMETKDAELAAKNDELAAKTREIAAKNAELAAKNAELAAKTSEYTTCRWAFCDEPCVFGVRCPAGHGLCEEHSEELCRAIADHHTNTTCVAEGCGERYCEASFERSGSLEISSRRASRDFTGTSSRERPRPSANASARDARRKTPRPGTVRGRPLFERASYRTPSTSSDRVAEPSSWTTKTAWP